MRDLDAIPYRWTSQYRRNLQIVARQRARMNHRVVTLWPSESGQPTSGLLRSAARIRR